MTELETVEAHIADHRSMLVELGKQKQELKKREDKLLFDIRQLLTLKTELERRERRDNPEPIATN